MPQMSLLSQAMQQHLTRQQMDAMASHDPNAASATHTPSGSALPSPALAGPGSPFSYGPMSAGADAASRPSFPTRAASAPQQLRCRSAHIWPNHTAAGQADMPPTRTRPPPARAHRAPHRPLELRMLLWMRRQTSLRTQHAPSPALARRVQTTALPSAASAPTPTASHTPCLFTPTLLP